MAKKFTAEELETIDRDWRALFESQTYAFLLVDPSVAQRKAFANGLRAAGAEVVEEAKDGMEALVALKAMEARPVIITELVMPTMDGTKLLKQLRANEKTKDVPVVLVSSEARKTMVIPAIKSGVSGYLKKPCEPKVLIGKLKELGFL